MPSRKKFLLPVKALSKLFRAKFRDALRKTDGFASIPASVWEQDWVVHCKPVGDGRTALDAIRRGPPPRLVLVDYWMPGMGGNEFLAALRAESDPALAGIPVVVMTADPDGVAGLLAPTPPDLLLEKPFGMRDLRRVVVRFCGPGSGSRRWGAAATHEPV